MCAVEPLSPHADALFAGLVADPPTRSGVPDLTFGECANVLWKYVRRFGCLAAEARQDVADLTALAMRSVSTADLASDALGIALSHGATVYDGCYVALAHRLGSPLVTSDEALIRQLAGTPYVLQWLGSLPT